MKRIYHILLLLSCALVIGMKANAQRVFFVEPKEDPSITAGPNQVKIIIHSNSDKLAMTHNMGEEKGVRILFDDKTFRFYDTRTDSWEVETGTYQIMIGSNAEEMLLAGSLAVNGTVTEGGYSREELPEYFSGEIKNISDDTFRRLYGREIPDGSWSGEIRMNDAVCQLYYGKGIFGKLFYGVLRILLKISEWQGKPNLNVLFNYNMPIRGYAKMTGGFVTMEMAEALTEMANGHRIKGTAHLIKAAVKRD